MNRLRKGTGGYYLDLTDGVIYSGKVNYFYKDNFYEIVLDGEFDGKRPARLGETFFRTKKEAVRAMIAAADKDIAFHKGMVAKFEKRKAYFSDKNFQMRYMGEVLK